MHEGRAWRRGAFDLVFSLAMLQEVSRVLTYEKLRKNQWLSDAEVVELLEALASQSVMVPGTSAVPASRDPADDKFLAAALEGEAEYVVTGDKDLLTRKANRGRQIVTPAAFLKVLRERRCTSDAGSPGLGKEKREGVPHRQGVAGYPECARCG